MFVHGQLVRDRRDEFGSVVDVPPPPPVVNASSAPAPYASPRFIFYHRSFEIHTRFRKVLMRILARTPNPAHPIDHFIMSLTQFSRAHLSSKGCAKLTTKVRFSQPLMECCVTCVPSPDFIACDALTLPSPPFCDRCGSRGCWLGGQKGGLPPLIPRGGP